MKALVYHGPGQKSWDTVKDPAPAEPTDIVVQIDTTTICGTDLHILKGDLPDVTPGRILGHEGVGVVMEGRDIGTAIFPDAEFKFFLDADVKTRARRRFEELRKKGASITEHEVLEQLIERDRRDSGRELAPLRRADDAIVLDSTNLSIEAVVAAMKAKFNARFNAAKDLKRA